MLAKARYLLSETSSVCFLGRLRGSNVQGLRRVRLAFVQKVCKVRTLGLVSWKGSGMDFVRYTDSLRAKLHMGGVKLPVMVGITACALVVLVLAGIGRVKPGACRVGRGTDHRSVCGKCCFA